VENRDSAPNEVHLRRCTCSRSAKTGARGPTAVECRSCEGPRSCRRSYTPRSGVSAVKRSAPLTFASSTEPIGRSGAVGPRRVFRGIARAIRGFFFGRNCYGFGHCLIACPQSCRTRKVVTLGMARVFEKRLDPVLSKSSRHLPEYLNPPPPRPAPVVPRCHKGDARRPFPGNPSASHYPPATPTSGTQSNPPALKREIRE